jgi:S1-C subfamily serine protease
MRYRWAFFAVVTKDMAPIELTQKNASVESAALALPAGSAAATHDTVKVLVAPPPPKVLTEREIFERDRAGLFTVFGVDRGTGFYADSNGLVITNAHLVDNADEVRVQIDSVTKVYARVIAKDRDKDVAVLAVTPKRCAKCAVLHFPDSAHNTPPGPGDRVIAFGSPMNKIGLLSLGIVSNADANTVVSDVLIGALNTGGPLVSKDGFVIGLNTDRTARTESGSRVETSVAAAVVAPLLAKGRDSIPALAAKPISDELLPVAPREPFPTAPIMAVAKLGNQLNIEIYSAEQGPFKIFMMTPQVMAWRQQQAVNALAAMKQDDPKRYSALTKVDPIQGWTDWDDYLADRKAVIVFNVFPERTEFPYYKPDKIQDVNEGSFRDMKIYRDNVEIIPVEKWRVPAMLNGEQMKAAGKAMPYQGIYIYRVSDFAPRAVGTTATYVVQMTDANNLKSYRVTLKSNMIEQMWKDFTAYQYGGRQ